MRWRRDKAAEQRSMTPADAADLAAAREARREVERAIETGRSRWAVINATADYLRKVHEENHLADDLRVIFTGTSSQRS